MLFGGGNLVTKPQENGYLDGIISQLTTQGEVTVNINFEDTEVTARKQNQRDAPERTYGGADVNEHHYVLPGELVFGWRNRQGRNVVPGNPNFHGWTSLNGAKYGDTSTDEELQSRIVFIAIAKAPYFFDKLSQPRHGFAGIAAGTGTTHHTGERDFFPGDDIMFSVVSRPLKPGINQPYPEGQYGDYGPGTRVGNPRRGTPRGKLRMRINPGRVTDMRPAFNPVLAAFAKTRRDGGIADMPFELLHTPPTDGSSRPTVVQEQAMLLAGTVVTTAVASLEFMANNPNTIGLLTAFTQANASAEQQRARQMAVVNALGVFKTSLGERRLLNELIYSLYLDHPVNKAASRVYLDRLKTAFKNDDGKLGNTPDKHFLFIRRGLSNAQTLGYARAVHFFARTKIGKAMSHATKGQRLDVLIGPSLNTF